MTTTYTSYNQLPLSLNANDIASVLGISRANAYTLMRAKGFPTIFIGKRMIVPRDKFIEWMDLQISAEGGNQNDKRTVSALANQIPIRRFSESRRTAVRSSRTNQLPSLQPARKCCSGLDVALSGMS